MKVVFTTNIDAYNEKRCVPEHFETVPRKGDFIEVKPDFISYYREQKLPIRLEIVSVTIIVFSFFHSYPETIVICELWYNKLDKELADFAGAKTL
jgi:hypothetical protein